MQSFLLTIIKDEKNGMTILNHCPSVFLYDFTRCCECTQKAKRLKNENCLIQLKFRRDRSCLGRKPLPKRNVHA